MKQRNSLREFFSDHLISKDLWPPRSLDLSPDFFLWGYLKGVVYRTTTHTLEEPKTNTEAAIANITVATLGKVSANIIKRACGCIHEHGAHLQHQL
jgi:hypothetical protein